MVRPLKTEDIPQLLEILRSLRATADGTTGIESWTETKFESEAASAHGYVQCESSYINGFIFYRSIPDGYEISLLATRPESRRKGVMARLLQSMVSSIPTGKVIWLEFHENNLPARNLYEKIGFKVSGVRPRYYANGAAAIGMEYRA